jgi:hypothetical protein
MIDICRVCPLRTSLAGEFGWNHHEQRTQGRHAGGDDTS